MSLNKAYSSKPPTRGMIPRKQETLKGPLKIARVGHTLNKGKPQSHEDNLSSPWWLSQGTMEHLWRLSRDSGTPLGTLIRQRCCIPNYWDSSCDLIYEAQIVGRLDAWIGPGTFFFPPDNDKTPGSVPKQHESQGPLWPVGDIVFFPAGEFHQIYIPGIWDREVRRAAFGMCTVVPVAAFAGAESYIGPRRLSAIGP